MGRITRLAAALPAVALAIASLVWLAMGLAGAHPFWEFVPLTLSEAAALRDGGEIVRLVSAGHDLNRRYWIRAGFLTSEGVELTPLEAAMAVDRPEIVDLLLELGAR